MTRAIIHIGVQKTGSTSIQSSILAGLDDLFASGIYVSRTMNAFGRHDFLPLICGQESLTDEIRKSLGMSNLDVPQYREYMIRMLQKEAIDNSNLVHLFSSEHCHTILYTCDCVSRMKEILDKIFSEVKILIYIRRQDRIALSYYSTHLRMGGAEPSPFNAIDRSNLNYEELFFRWMSVFGRANVEVRIFDDIEKTGQSVVADFGEAIGCPGMLVESRENGGLGPAEQQLMQLINCQMGGFDGNTIRSAISLVSGSSRHAVRLKVSRSDALEYMSMFSVSNEAVRGAYFPERSSLFDEDYSDYPDERTPVPIETLLALSTDSLAEGGRIISDLEHRIRLLEADIADAAAASASLDSVAPGNGRRHSKAIRPRIWRQIAKLLRS